MRAGCRGARRHPQAGMRYCGGQRARRPRAITVCHVTAEGRRGNSGTGPRRRACAVALLGGVLPPCGDEPVLQGSSRGGHSRGGRALSAELCPERSCEVSRERRNVKLLLLEKLGKDSMLGSLLPANSRAQP
ncbi:uncharacterized protein FYW23_003860 [Sylvia borin]